MFTKSDKQWLKDNFLTKNDAKSFATKDDLKNFATKADLKDLASKKDLKSLEKRLDKRFKNLFNFLDKDVMNTKKRLKTIEENLGVTPDLTN